MAEPPRARTVPRWLTPGTFILLGLIWGSSFLWIKIAVDEIPPATLVAYRMSLGALGLLAFLAVRGQLAIPNGRQLVPLAILGAINTALPIFLISWGEQFVDSGTAAVLNSLVPIFSLISLPFFLRAGHLLCTLACSSGSEAPRSWPAASWRCAVTWRASSARWRWWLPPSRTRWVPPSRSTASVHGATLGLSLFAALYMCALALVADGGLIVPTQADTIVAVIWLGVLGSFIAYLCYFFLLEELGATLTTMVTYVFPVVGVTLGVVVLGELLDWRLVLGTVLVTLGIGVVSLRYDAVVSRVASRGRA